MEQPCLRPIGVLHGDIERIEDAPKNFSISDRTAPRELSPKTRAARRAPGPAHPPGPLFCRARASRDVLKVYPRGDRSRGLRGVFATRSPVRPNPIAISHLEVLSVRENRIEVRGLDILDGTPVIDIKKELGPDQDRKTGG